MMMLAFTLATTLQYGFAPGMVRNYSMKVEFNGFLPILGGQEGKVEVDIGFKLKGNKAEEGQRSATSDIDRFKIVFNGATLPLTTDNVKEFFPETTIVVEPRGKLVSTTAPNLSLPVRLPGLDVKRFPDISYLAIEFPDRPLAKDDTWTFSKSFGDTPVVFDCRLVEVTDDEARIDLKMSQTYQVFEDEDKQVVVKKEDAFAEVKTTMQGGGSATFDRKLGLLSTFAAKANSISEVTEIKSGKQSKRTLSNSLDVRLVRPVTGSDKVASNSPSVAAGTWWNRVIGFGERLWNQAGSYYALLRLGLGTLPAMLAGTPYGDLLGRWLQRIIRLEEPSVGKTIGPLGGMVRLY
jgi:hypothetical protein